MVIVHNNQKLGHVNPAYAFMLCYISH